MRRLASARLSGFTLIEIMVVIFVIGITAVGVSLVIGRGGPDTELRKAVERFATLSDFASERAILSGRPVGLMLEPPAWRQDMDENLEKAWRYRWQMMGPTGWEDEPNLEAVELAPSVQLDVMVEEQMWEWEDAPEVRLPVVVFYPSGEVTPFKIEFRDQRIPDFSQNVVVNTWGEVEWLEQARPAEDTRNGF